MKKDYTPSISAETRFVFVIKDIEEALRVFAESKGHTIPKGESHFCYHPVRDHGCGATNESFSLTITHE